MSTLWLGMLGRLKPAVQDTIQPWRQRVILERSGYCLLLSVAVAAAGAYQGILTTAQIACFFALGPLWAKCIVHPLPLAGGRKLSGELCLLIFLLTGIGRMNPVLYDHAPYWEIAARSVSTAFYHVGCIGVVTFLILWLFREVLLRYVDPSPNPRS